MDNRMMGRITRVMIDKNFGFILGKDSREYFFHRSALTNMNWRPGLTNMMVTFEPTDAEKGPRAEDVQAV